MLALKGLIKFLQKLLFLFHGNTDIERGFFVIKELLIENLEDANVTQRRQILRLILESEPTAEDVDLNRMSKMTENFSGSDLRELCRNASVYRVRDYMRVSNAKNSVSAVAPVRTVTARFTVRPEGDIISTDTLSDDDEFHDALRPITMEDLVISVNKMKESKVRTGSLFMTPLDMD
uniref:AAA ATPase AAA+ lid domain-containing protein n=1 Tax=Timema cristinae TaxID=61476 RepID=A0A7R9CW70_TIMCR|nr:unnamed protein product [Timema cristinae]